MRLDDYLHLIRNVPDFPKRGILFKDITPMLAHGPALRAAIDDMIDATAGFKATVILGVESRGFLFAAPMAYATARGVVLVRKPGKLPAKVLAQKYGLEYGTDTIEIHSDAIKPGDRVVIIDDVLATGGTARAAADLVLQCGGTIAGYGFLGEIGVLEGSKRLTDAPVVSLIRW
jgi:adenine phosphoribosyltransferase